MRNVACVIEVGACVTLSYATQGVACPLLNEGADASEASIKGRAFCFLPLPAETGLPVHVNGYFELSSNRRDIWRGDDLAGEGRTRAEWNKALLAGVYALLRSHVGVRTRSLIRTHRIIPSRRAPPTRY